MIQIYDKVYHIIHKSNPLDQENNGRFFTSPQTDFFNPISENVSFN
jgi:hypothetical protein